MDIQKIKQILGVTERVPLSLQNGGRQPIIVNDKNDPRLKNYNDSLNLYNSFFKGQDYLDSSKEIDFTDRSKLDLINPPHPTIRPIETIYYQPKDFTDLYKYKKPIQPVIYQESRPQESRPKEPTFELNQEQQYLPQEEQHLEFDPIGLKKGTYFTRPRQQQEAGSGNVVDYFDSKTGKLLKTMQDGGKVNTLEGDLYAKILINRNKDKDFIQRAQAVGNYPESNMFQQFDAENFGNKNSHLMGYGEDNNGQTYMFPTILNDKREVIPVPNQYADYISSVGYKKATGIPFQNGGKISEEEYKKLALKAVQDAEEANREKYIPSQAVKNTKALNALAQLAQPYNPYFKAIGTGGDIATAIRYGLDGQYNKMFEDFTQAGLQWIPFTKGSPAMKQGTYNLSLLQNMFNFGLNVTQKGSDAQTVKEAFQNGGMSSLGYKHNSPYENNPFNLIDSNQITMKGVTKEVIGISNTGDIQEMKPNQEYKFDGTQVLEFPKKGRVKLSL